MAEQIRAARARNGSRRKRDLVDLTAAHAERRATAEAWVRENLPELPNNLVPVAMTAGRWLRHGDEEVSVEAIWLWLKQGGWLRDFPELEAKA